MQREIGSKLIAELEVIRREWEGERARLASVHWLGWQSVYTIVPLGGGDQRERIFNTMRYCLSGGKWMCSVGLRGSTREEALSYVLMEMSSESVKMAGKLAQQQGQHHRSGEDLSPGQKKLQGISSKEKYTMFRNIMVNELKISKDDIEEWVKDCIERDVSGLVKGGVVSDVIREAVLSKTSAFDIQQEIRNRAREAIADVIKDTVSIGLSIKEKKKSSVSIEKT